MHTIWRVTYPLITRDGQRDFTNREEANKFFYEMRNKLTQWRHVRMFAVEDRADVRADYREECKADWQRTGEDE